MAREEVPLFVVVFKQRPMAGDVRARGETLFQSRKQRFDVAGVWVEVGFRRVWRRIRRPKRRAERDIDFRVVGYEKTVHFARKGARKRRAQLRQMVQRAAQERHAPGDRLAAGQTRNRLVHNRLEDRRGKVIVRDPLVDQRLEVGFGKHAAA